MTIAQGIGYGVVYGLSMAHGQSGRVPGLMRGQEVDRMVVLNE